MHSSRDDTAALRRPSPVEWSDLKLFKAKPSMTIANVPIRFPSVYEARRAAARGPTAARPSSRASTNRRTSSSARFPLHPDDRCHSSGTPGEPRMDVQVSRLVHSFAATHYEDLYQRAFARGNDAFDREQRISEAERCWAIRIAPDFSRLLQPRRAHRKVRGRLAIHVLRIC
jgi:hypothetical protein